MNVNFPTIPSKKLAVAISSAATSFQLNNILGWGGTALTAADFGTVAYAVFKNNTNTLIEVMKIDPATIASASISILARGLPLSGTINDTPVSGNALDWNANETIVELGSNPPQLYASFATLADTQTFTGLKTFTTATRPVLSSDADTAVNAALVTYGQLSRVVLGGGVPADETHAGIASVATEAEGLAGTDTRTISGSNYYLLTRPSYIAKNIQNSVYNYSSGAGFFTPAFLTGDTGAEGTFGTWGAVTNGSFRITIDGVAYNCDDIDFTGVANMDDVATKIQTAIRTATGNLETCVWSTNHFIISSVDTTLTSAITVTSTSTGTVGTDISGAGASDWMDCESGNGVVTNKVLLQYRLTITPTPSALTAGQRFIFKADSASGGATDVKIGALDAKNLFKNHDQELELNDIEAGSIVQVVYDGTNFQMLNQQATMPTTAILGQIGNLFTGYGGTGADGALSITTGTTTINLGGLQFVEKNYTSISITGDGKLAFSNPHATGTVIVLKSQGNVTITSTSDPAIDISNCGGAGGASVVDNDAVSGNAGNNGYSLFLKTIGATAPTSGGAGGKGLKVALNTSGVFSDGLQMLSPYSMVFMSSGGSSGALNGGNTGDNATSGKGGNGGGTLVIECGGYFNFTGIIKGDGQSGGNGIGASVCSAGGGGGGAGGCVLINYQFLTENSGTITCLGGSGGTSDNTYAGHPAYAGGGGGSLKNDGNDGNGTTSGGNGAVGYYRIFSRWT